LRTLVRVSALLSLVLFGSGCDESFNPKTAMEEQYVLQCFVRGGDGAPATVTAVLARTYDVNGFDPATNTVDPAIAGAEVKLTIDQKPYYLLGALRPSLDTDRYATRQWVYTNTVPPPKLDAAVVLSARLPNGKTLSAQTNVPRGRNFSNNYVFAAGITTHMNLEPGKPNWTVSWDNYDDTEVHLFVPRLTITYTKAEGGDETFGTVSVPLKYVSSGSGTIPIYPSLTTQKQCSFEFAALDSAMAQISGGDPDKKKFGVHAVLLEVIEYDLPLSKYFASINGSLDQYSIRTDESVFSNVGGGIGIVGSFIIHKIQFDLDPRYVYFYNYRYR